VNKTTLVPGGVGHWPGSQPAQPEALWESFAAHRFIMTSAPGFSVPKWRAPADLVSRKFRARLLIVDGLSFDEPLRDSLST